MKIWVVIVFFLCSFSLKIWTQNMPKHYVSLQVETAQMGINNRLSVRRFENVIPRFGATGQLNYERRIWKKWYLTTGFGYQIQRFDYGEKHYLPANLPENSVNYSIINDYQIHFSNVFETFTGSATVELNGNHERELNISYSKRLQTGLSGGYQFNFWKIPLGIKRVFGNRKFKMAVGAGINARLLQRSYFLYEKERGVPFYVYGSGQDVEIQRVDFENMRPIFINRFTLLSNDLQRTSRVELEKMYFSGYFSLELSHSIRNNRFFINSTYERGLTPTIKKTLENYYWQQLGFAVGLGISI